MSMTKVKQFSVILIAAFSSRYQVDSMILRAVLAFPENKLSSAAYI
jgi:hypothetical protein